jgi:hypothetical protein
MGAGGRAESVKGGQDRCQGGHKGLLDGQEGPLGRQKGL